MDDCRVKHVMFYAPLRPGNLLLCECEDGSLCIFRDDIPLPGHRWHMRDVVKAIVAYQEMRLNLIDQRTRKADRMDAPVKIEVDEESRCVVVLVPWHRLAATTRQNQQDWLDKVATIRDHWHAKGYQTSLRTDPAD